MSQGSERRGRGCDTERSGPVAGTCTLDGTGNRLSLPTTSLSHRVRHHVGTAQGEIVPGPGSTWHPGQNPKEAAATVEQGCGSAETGKTGRPPCRAQAPEGRARPEEGAAPSLRTSKAKSRDPVRPRLGSCQTRDKTRALKHPSFQPGLRCLLKLLLQKTSGLQKSCKKHTEFQYPVTQPPCSFKNFRAAPQW